MNREDAVRQIDDPSVCWDVLVIGGGATGLGCAVEAASRGYQTLLLDQADFAQATSSRSTKLVHGGFRYLKQGNISLVRHSLRERGFLLHNAPHLVHRLAFVLPCYGAWDRPFYGLGLKLYDRLAGRENIGPSQSLSREETLTQLPRLNPNGLRGGIRYFDGQFDDARLAVCLALTLFDLGGLAINYFAATALLKERGQVTGIEARDQETGRLYTLRARSIINATGVFADSVRSLDEPAAAAMITVSQGTHLVLPATFLPGSTALMVPKTDDGRILFAIPWQDRVLVGTTDTPVPKPSLHPSPLPEEIDFLLQHADRYLTQKPQTKDVLCAFSGLRPLVSTRPEAPTSRLARDHVIQVSPSGLITITGGKWTTYRQMAEETIDRAIPIARLEARPSRTKSLRLHGWKETNGSAPSGVGYGSDQENVQLLARENPALANPIHPRLPYRQCEIIWAARQEMARTLEDVLARRTRALFLDTRAAIEAAPAVVALLAAELQREDCWQKDQLAAFTRSAQACLPNISS